MAQSNYLKGKNLKIKHYKRMSELLPNTTPKTKIGFPNALKETTAGNLVPHVGLNICAPGGHL